MKYKFYTADVFTDQKFSGNQLAVFPQAEGLGSEEMQAIAREFNFSEVTFVFSPQNSKNTRRLRIFTPGAEVPFAGHPTIGTASVLAAIGEVAVTGDSANIIFEEGVGEVPVTVKITGDTLYAELRAAIMPEFRPSGIGAGDISEIISLAVSDLTIDGYPLTAVSCGLPFLFVPVRSLAAMSSIKINQAKWETVLKSDWDGQLYLFTKETVAADCDFHARMFAFDLGFGEDPATGSAAAAFAGYYGRLMSVKDGPIRLTVEQGLEMGRPSKLFIRAEKNADDITAIKVGGNTVLMSEGMIRL